MRPRAILMLPAFLAFSCAAENHRVLLFVPEESSALEFMLASEAVVKKELLVQSGFEVVVAHALRGDPFGGGGEPRSRQLCRTRERCGLRHGLRCQDRAHARQRSTS